MATWESCVPSVLLQGAIPCIPHWGTSTHMWVLLGPCTGEGPKGRHPPGRAVVWRNKSGIGLPCPELDGSGRLWGPAQACCVLSPLGSLFSGTFQIPKLLGRPQGSQTWLGPHQSRPPSAHCVGDCTWQMPATHPNRDDRSLAQSHTTCPGPTSPPSLYRPCSARSPPLR